MGSNDTTVSMVTLVGAVMIVAVWGLEQAGVVLPGPVQQACATILLAALAWFLPKGITSGVKKE